MTHGVVTREERMPQGIVGQMREYCMVTLLTWTITSKIAQRKQISVNVKSRVFWILDSDVSE